MELRAAALWMSKIEPQESEIAILIQRAVAGDVTAFEQLILRYERRVMTLAWRLLGTMEDAQDASQEVFLRAYKYLHRFDSGRKFEPWLVGMTVNVCRDLGRKRQRYPNVPIETEMLQAGGDPHSEFSSEQRRQMIHRFLAELPEKERSAVVLRDIEGFSTAEVAQILGSSEVTVRSQISNARVKLRKAIERLRGRL